MPAIPFHKRDYVLISAYAFALSYLAGTGPLVLPQLAERVAPAAMLATAYSALRVVGLLVAIVVQPIGGVLSDRARTRFGRRKPFILLGTLGSLVFLAAMLFATLSVGSYLLLLLAYIGLQVTANIATGANHGLIPDRVPEKRRSVAAGTKSLLEVIASIIASLLIAILLSHGQWLEAFISMGVLLVLATVVIWLAVREESSSFTPTEQARVSWRDLFTLDRRRDQSFIWWLVSRFFMMLGIYPLSTYALLFVKKVMPEVEPNTVAGSLLALNAVLIALTAQPAGIIALRVGLKRMVLIAGALNVLGVFLMLFAHGTVLFTVAGYAVRDMLLLVSPVGIGYGIFLTTNWALGIELSPKDACGKYLGLSNLGTAGAGLVAALLGGPIIDTVGFAPIFVGGVLSILCGMALLTRVQTPAVESVPRPTLVAPAYAEPEI